MSQVLIAGALIAFLPLVALGQTPAFEAASVKPGTVVQPPPGSQWKSTGASVREDPGRITYQNITLLRVLMRAYNVKQRQITAPSWLGNETYDIAATLPAGASKEQIPVMLQTLLAQRFKMTVRLDNRTERIYNLTAGKNPRLKKSEATETSVNFDAKGHTEFVGYTLTAFADALTNLLDHAVVDATGIQGRFDISTHLDIALPSPPGAASEDATDPAPSLFAAMQDLGLKLEAAEGPVKHITVDKVEKNPTEN